MAKGSGVNTAVAKKAYNAVNKALADLETNIKRLQTHVEEMNRNSWYGGKSSVNWYKKTDNVYKNLVKFDSGVNNFQSTLKQQFAKSTAAGIDFGGSGNSSSKGSSSSSKSSSKSTDSGAYTDDEGWQSDFELDW